MMKNTVFLVSLFLGMLGISACFIDFTADEPNKFSCVTDEDCEGNYECKADNENGGALFCKLKQPGIDPECPDIDGDKYGVGEDRRFCKLCKTQGKCDEDPDDTNPAIYPGAPEICDGIDNDGDGATDNYFDITCPTEKCPPAPAGSNLDILCVNNKCVAKMVFTRCITPRVAPDVCPCNNEELVCTGGAFPMVPSSNECQ